jgi:plastocyanin
MKKFFLALSLVVMVSTGCDQAPAKDSSAVDPAATSTASQAVDYTKEKNTVVIANYSFNPAVITIKAGTTIKWVNLESVPHVIFSEGNFTSDALNRNDSFSFTFAKPGTYNYICGIQTYMKGRIIAEE